MKVGLLWRLGRRVGRSGRRWSRGLRPPALIVFALLAACFVAPASARAQPIGSWTGSETARPSGETYTVDLHITQLALDQDAGTVHYTGLCSANCIPPASVDCTDTLTLTSISSTTYTFQE